MLLSENTGEWSCLTCKERVPSGKLPTPPPEDPRVVANRELRKRSGSVNSTFPLVDFLYLLLRDHVPLSVVETLVRECPNVPCSFTNGYLARYAIDVAQRLCPNMKIEWSEEKP
jgi:hypothetical protein